MKEAFAARVREHLAEPLRGGYDATFFACHTASHLRG
jgi:hypothetical protein